MRVAVLTLTRDRLELTKRTFASLAENAGCEYDHYVFDQGSLDGTLEWLRDEHKPFVVMTYHENIGICCGLNALLGQSLGVAHHGPYDVVVKVDNDIELLQRNTLRDVAEAALEGDCLLSPRIQGLRNSVPVIGEFLVGAETIEETPIIGGAFLAAPARVFTEIGYRHNESNPIWEGDDRDLCAWWRQRGGRVGYVKRLVAIHDTDSQHASHPAYWAAKRAEGCPC